MNDLISNPWYYWPTIISLFVCVLICSAGVIFNANDFPKNYSSHSFDGPTKALSQNGIFGSVLPVIGLTSDKINADNVSVGILGAMVTMSVVSSFIGFWFYQHVQNLRVPNNDAVELKSSFWIGLQGAVFVGFVSVGVMLLVFLFKSPIFSA